MRVHRRLLFVLLGAVIWASAGGSQPAVAQTPSHPAPGSTQPKPPPSWPPGMTEPGRATARVAPGGCTAVDLYASPPPPLVIGVGTTNVDFFATVSGCTSPQYQFWLLPPGGTWSIVQPYGPTSTWRWSTQTGPSGTWYVVVWARQAGSADAYEASSYIAYERLPITAVCSYVEVSHSPASPQVAGAIVAVTASAGYCSSPLYQFRLRSPSGVWSVAQDFSPSGTFQWNTSGLAGGTWTVEVRAKQSGSTAAYEALQSFTYRLIEAGGAPCTSVQLQTNLPPPQPVGTSVNVSTRSVTGCPAPEYQYWLLPPGGQWQIAKVYSGSTGFVWNTAGLAPGTWFIVAWVRQQGASEPYQTSASYSYTLTEGSGGTPCGGMGVTVSTWSATAGQPVTFQASSSGCTTPAYQFWLRGPGSSTWTVARPYSTSNSFTWNTTGAAPGEWTLVVWARQAGSAAAYETSFAMSYQLR